MTADLKAAALQAIAALERTAHATEAERLAAAAALRAGLETPAPAEAHGEPLAVVRGMDEYGPFLDWFKHWTTIPIGATLYGRPQVADLGRQEPAQSGVDSAVRGGGSVGAGDLGAVADDQAIELASALELHRAVRIVSDVAALPVGGKAAEQPTQFHAGYQLACEEIAERIRTEVHVLPGGLTLPGCGPLPSVRQPAHRDDLCAAFPDVHCLTCGRPASNVQPKHTVAERLLAQVREVCAATLRAGPGVAVTLPAELAEEGRKFMRGEASLIEQLPFADVQKLGDVLNETPATVQAPAPGAEPVAEVVERCMDGGSRESKVEYYLDVAPLRGAKLPPIGTKLYAAAQAPAVGASEVAK